jgi:glycosyltransferase involved in cell wall biosynthesis
MSSTARDSAARSGASAGRASRAPRVLYVQYANPAAYPPIEHSAKILADAGFDVRLLGIDVLADRLAFTAHPRIDVRLRRRSAPGARQKLHYAAFVLWAISVALRWRPDWVYASDPLSCPTAAALSLLVGGRLIYHEHDSPQDEAPASAFMRLVMALRRRVGRTASLCVLPNGRRAEQFVRATGCREAVTVWNCPLREDVTDGAAGRPDGLRVLYHGSIGSTRLPQALVGALAKLPASVTLTIAGYETAGHAGHIEALQAEARARGVADRVRYVGTVARRGDLMRQCAAADVGLALMPLKTADVNEDAMVGASNKVFDYMAGGLAVLVSDRPDWRAAFVDGGYGLGCDPESPDSIAGALTSWLANPTLRVEMGERGRQQIATAWNYETAFAPILARMAGASPTSGLSTG